MKDIIDEQFGYLRHEIEMCNITFRFALTLNEILLRRKDIYARCYNDPFLVYSDRAHKITAFIALGKIYDTDDGTVSIHQMVKWMNENKGLFAFNEIEKRKRAVITEEQVREFMKSVHTFAESDFRNLHQLKSVLTVKYVENLRPLRNKVYAHREEISMQDIESLYEKIDDRLILELAEGANGIYRDIWAGFHDGIPFSLKPLPVYNLDAIKASTEKYLIRYLDKTSDG